MTRLEKAQAQATKNQAEYWHAFAYLAVNGRRNIEQYQWEGIQASFTAPSDEQVQAIKAEAKALSDELQKEKVK